jgi:hypothetical protein
LSSIIDTVALPLSEHHIAWPDGLPRIGGHHVSPEGEDHPGRVEGAEPVIDIHLINRHHLGGHEPLARGRVIQSGYGRFRGVERLALGVAWFWAIVRVGARLLGVVTGAPCTEQAARGQCE